MGGNSKMLLAVFTVKNGQLDKIGSCLPDDSDEVIAYEMNEKGRPIKELGRIKLK